MLGDFGFLNKILRYSVINILWIPIYIFASGKYTEPQMTAIASLSIFAIITTYFWWGKVNPKNNLWKYIDRLVVISLIGILYYYGNKETMGFLSLGILFFFVGQSDTFKESDSYLNHMLFRYFVGLGLIIYVTNEPYRDIFVILSSFFTVIGVYYSVKDIDFSTRKSIIF